MLVVFPYTLISVFLGKIKGGNFVYRLCSYWSDIWFFLTGIRVQKINAHLYNRDKKYIIVPNHISYLDIAVMVNVFRQPMRPLGKAEMARVPVFGFIYKQTAVTVNRENAANRIKSVSILKSVINKGISILVFPEGTFNTTAMPLKNFYNGAFRIAIETQKPLKPVLFLDTFDRLHPRSIFSLTPGKCRVVYLPDIEAKGLTLNDTEDLKQKTYQMMEQELIRYNAKWIKTSTIN